MAKKLPAEAFTFYVGLGPERSYQAVARRYGVTKQAVTRLATREEWQRRLAEVERRAQVSAELKAQETLEAMNDRHMKTLQVIQKKALEALRSMPLTSAMEAVRALDIAIGKERLVRGEPSERTEVSVEDVIRREYSRWMVVGGGKEQHDDGQQHGA